MSGSSDPTAPSGLAAPKRPSARRLRRTPLYLGAAAVFLVLGAGGWVLATIDNSDGASSSAAAPDAVASASTGDWLVGKPTGAIDPYGLHHDQTPPPLTPPPAHPASAPAARTLPAPVVEAGMTQTELAGRKAAWDAYYQAQATRTTQIAEAQRSSFSGDAQAAYAQDPAAGTKGGGKGDAPAAGAGASLGDAAAGGERQRGAFGPDSNPSTDYLENGVTLPVSAYEIKAGDIIKFRTLQGLTNETTGTFVAIVTEPVCDHATGLNILIPQGARLFGSYDNQQINGDERLPAAITRILFPPPGDESLDLTHMAASDQAGYGGFHDQVDSHTLKLLLNALVLGAFGAATQLSQPQTGTSQYGGYSSQQVIAGSLGQQLGQVGAAYAQKGLNVKPTLTIRPGYSGVLQMTKDIAFRHPWHPSAGPVTVAGEIAQ